MRRARLAIAALAVALPSAGCGGDATSDASAAAPDATGPSQWVNPFVGTDAGQPDFGTGGGAGNTFPGAVVPFGMIQLSPDTEPANLNFAGGYSWPDDRLEGFSLTHFSGAGCANYQDIAILPTTEAMTESPAQLGRAGIKRRFQPRFDHAHESAAPGDYRVTLDPGTDAAIDVELTVTRRAGAARFAFPETEAATVLINAGASAMANEFARVAIDPDAGVVTGSATSGNFCFHGNKYTVHFAIAFDRPVIAHGTWIDDQLRPGTRSAEDTSLLALNYQPVPGGPGELPGNPSGTARAGAYLTFDTTTARKIEARMAISFVSVDNARRNLEAEAAGRSLESIRRAARAAWDEALSRIDVEGGDPAGRRTFYTALYHSLLHPNVFSDVNGEYVGFDGQIHAAEGWTKHANFSGWDIYRTHTPLVALLFPERAGDMVRSLLADFEQSGWLPKWSQANGHTDVMVGDPADLIIAGSHAFGAKEFDLDAAVDAMIKGATQSERAQSERWRYIQRQALTEYETLGYVPLEHDQHRLNEAATVVDPALIWGSAATTLEYALADFGIGRMAAAACRPDDAARFYDRAGRWRNLFDAGFIKPRSATGLFDPLYDPASGHGFVEGSGAQYTWLVPQDVGGLVEAMGGRAAAAERLDRFFQRLNAGPESARAFLGNEPSLHVPWLYHWVGQPWKTRPILESAAEGLYGDGPGGLPGNDDGGTLSAWYVWASMGLYPVIPGTNVLALSAPLFDTVRLHLPDGDVRIENRGDGPHVESLTLDGESIERAWLSYDEIRNGAALAYTRAAQPGDWGTAPAAEPPSFDGLAVPDAGCND